MGTAGDSYDNALAESAIGLHKTRCVKIDGPIRTAQELELATLSSVHWSNENRLHSSIDNLTPIEKEMSYQRPRCQRQRRSTAQVADVRWFQLIVMAMSPPMPTT
jgi:putative transposase